MPRDLAASSSDEPAGGQPGERVVSEHPVRCHLHGESTPAPPRPPVLVLDFDFYPSDLSDLPILRRRKPGPVAWQALDVDPSDAPLPCPPKPGPPTWEGLLDREFRIRRMAFLLIHGCLRAIAKDLGVARADAHQQVIDGRFDARARMKTSRRLGCVVGEHDQRAPAARVAGRQCQAVAKPRNGLSQQPGSRVASNLSSLAQVNRTWDWMPDALRGRHRVGGSFAPFCWARANDGHDHET
jgi:hypothetical protein